jgi:hypothetical protein
MLTYFQVVDFFKDSVGPEAILRGLEARKQRAGQVHAGLEGLVNLLSPSQDTALRLTALEELAEAKVRTRAYAHARICILTQIRTRAYVHARICILTRISTQKVKGDYMRGLTAGSEAAEHSVRTSFQKLITCLVDLARATAGYAGSVHFAHALRALDVAMHGVDLDQLVCTELLQLLEDYWQGGRRWEAWAHDQR